MDGNYIITANGSFANEADLYHWGIKGMRWGVRRYQNADGSLTAAGRKRYTNPDGSLNEKGKKYYAKERSRLIAERKVIKNTQKTNDLLSRLEAQRRNNEALKKANAPKKEEPSKPKTAKEMTDDELDAAILRARKEDEYNRLRPEPVKKTGFMDDLISNVVKPAVMTNGKNMLMSMMDKAAKDLMKDKIDPNSYDALKKTYDKLKIKADIDALKNPKNADYDAVKKEYDILKLKKDIEDLKSGKPKELTWDEKIKKQQYENNEAGANLKKREDAVKAREDAVKAREDAAKSKGNASNNGGGSNNSGSKSPKETESKGKSFVDRIIGSDYSRSYTTASEYYSKDYEKRVDSLLNKIDNIGWEQYYKERGGK